MVLQFIFSSRSSMTAREAQLATARATEGSFKRRPVQCQRQHFSYVLLPLRGFQNKQRDTRYWNLSFFERKRLLVVRFTANKRAFVYLIIWDSRLSSLHMKRLNFPVISRTRPGPGSSLFLRLEKNNNNRMINIIYWITFDIWSYDYYKIWQCNISPLVIDFNLQVMD